MKTMNLCVSITLLNLVLIDGYAIIQRWRDTSKQALARPPVNTARGVILHGHAPDYVPPGLDISI
jgi:hypothetical protein